MQGFIVFAKLDTGESVVWLVEDRSWSDDFMQKPMQHTLERAENFVNAHLTNTKEKTAFGGNPLIGVKSVCVVPAFEHPYTVA